MATYGTRGFEQQSVRAFIKSKYCKAQEHDCTLSVHPPRFPGDVDKICSSCDLNYKFHYDEMKEEMKRSRTATVIRLVKASCAIGACKTGTYDCGTCGNRTANMKETTKEYFELQKLACDAYLYRVFGVPRDGIGYDNEVFRHTAAYKDINRAAFFANWRPFVGPQGGFECNYPALFLRMTKENAQELSSIVFEYTVKPMEEQNEERSKLKRFSRSFIGNMSSGGADRFSEDDSIRSVSRTSSILSQRPRELFRKGSESLKQLKPVVSGFLQDEKTRLGKMEETLKGKYNSYKKM